MLDAKLSAHCNRVAVEDGHMECVSIKLRKKATREEIWRRGASLQPLARGQHLPTAPGSRWSTTRGDRPQPRLDRMRGNGMAGDRGPAARVQSLLDWKFVVLSHNTIRGAAGAAC
jgi:aspartate-semialdehyde dehydrogenase